MTLKKSQSSGPEADTLILGLGSSKPACEIAQEWVSTNSDRLPKTLQEFSAFPPAYQKAIFVALSPSEKSFLWRTQLSTFLKMRTDLSTQQRGVAKEFMEFLTPYRYGIHSRDPRWRDEVEVPLSRLTAQIELAFPNPDSGKRRVFRDLRSDDQDYAIASGAILLKTVLSNLVGGFATGAQMFGECECADIGDCPPCTGRECDDGNCEPTSGCGMGDLSDCTGTCVCLAG